MTASELLPLLGGMAGLAAVIVSGVTAAATWRRIPADIGKVRADEAAVLSTSAVGLVEPYRQQVKDMGDEMARTRAQAHQVTAELADANEALRRMHQALAELMDLVTRWREAVLAPDDRVSREALREMVSQAQVGPNGLRNRGPA